MGSKSTAPQVSSDAGGHCQQGRSSRFGVERPVSRRRFLTQTGGTLAAASLLGTRELLGQRGPLRKQVLVMSDIHVGHTAAGLDGAQWLRRAFFDLEKNVGPLSYGLTLGDITHYGDRRSLIDYLTLRDKSPVSRWFELAGNHEYFGRGIGHFTELVRSTDPYCFVDGNIAWFCISDEMKRAPGNMTDKSYQWLKKTIPLHRDKIIILCSHQPPPNTVLKSREDFFCLHPREKVEDILQRFPIDLYLCGHEHHSRYSSDRVVQKHHTTFINVASVTHAYRTHTSDSVILELEHDAKHIVARHRNHDKNRYEKRFEVRVPLKKRLRLSLSSVQRKAIL